MTMHESGKGPIGLANDGSFQVGSRRTYPVDVGTAWRTINSTEGAAFLTGHKAALRADSSVEVGDPCFAVTTFIPLSHLRMRWRRSGWEGDSILQVRVLKARGGATIAIHQEKLGDEGKRAEMLAHWEGVHVALGSLFAVQ
jgi:hypothetical protein